MELDEKNLKSEERFVLPLRALYRRYGYSQYRMSRFEEYDLYAKNKDFLVSDGIITFTDTTGKLMALKPDVTLSIIKNAQDTQEGLCKVCYDEGVFRIARSTHAFAEITQTGLECIGHIGLYEICEVAQLARESLGIIGGEGLLELSHVGLVSALLAAGGVSTSHFQEALAAIGSKSLCTLRALLSDQGSVDPDQLARALTASYATPEEAIQAIRPLCQSQEAKAALNETRQVLTFLSAQKGVPVSLDFSVINDMSYYSGIVFVGYLNGVPTKVLSGGQYDGLMRRMGREDQGAIGFAVYIDGLQRVSRQEAAYDVDTVLCYEPDASPVAVFDLARKLSAEGSVRVCESEPDHLTYGRLLRIDGKGKVTE